MSIPFQSVAIIGPGLLGASLALALRKLGNGEGSGAPSPVIHLWARREEALKEAQAFGEGGIADHYYTNLNEAVKDADLIVLCVPVPRMRELCETFVDSVKPTALVTDVGSVKGHVNESLAPVFHDKCHWIGSHPMAGSEKAGLAAACPDLYRDACVVITPTEDIPDEVVKTLHDFWGSLGCRVREFTPENHDHYAADISHVPHLIAAAMVLGIDEKSLQMVGPGFRDTTRIAGSSSAMWREILTHNRKASLESLDSFLASAQCARDLLAEERDNELEDFLERGSNLRKSMWVPSKP